MKTIDYHLEERIRGKKQKSLFQEGRVEKEGLFLSPTAEH
jgi:hypothetical protein